MPGFTVLQWLLPKHASVPGIYFLLMAMSLGQHVRELPENCQVSPFPPKPHSLLSSFSVFLPLVLFSVRFLTFSLSIHVFPLHCLMLTLTCSYLFMFVVLSFSLRERLHQSQNVRPLTIFCSSYIAHFTITVSHNVLYIQCPGQCANNIHVIFLSSLGSIQPFAAIVTQKLFQTQYQPLPIPGTHLYPRVKRSNYSKEAIIVSCSRTQVS